MLENTTLKPKHLFQFTYEVGLQDLDFMGIVGDNQWLTFLLRARIDLLAKIGIPFSELKRRKIGGVVSENHIKYLKPATYGDNLTISILPVEFFTNGCTIKYLIANYQKQKCLESTMTLIFLSEEGKSVNIPEEIKQNLFLKNI